MIARTAFQIVPVGIVTERRASAICAHVTGRFASNNAPQNAQSQTDLLRYLVFSTGLEANDRYRPILLGDFCPGTACHFV